VKPTGECYSTRNLHGHKSNMLTEGAGVGYRAAPSWSICGSAARGGESTALRLLDATASGASSMKSSTMGFSAESPGPSYWSTHAGNLYTRLPVHSSPSMSMRPKRSGLKITESRRQDRGTTRVPRASWGNADVRRKTYVDGKKVNADAVHRRARHSKPGS
jgi:hypothetical protein